MYSVYVLYSVESDKVYIGSTNDVERRLTEHNAGKSSSTKKYRPWKLVHEETFGTSSEARKREMMIKSWKNRDYMLEKLEIDLGN